MKFIKNNPDKITIIYLIGVAIIIRLVLAFINAYPFDFWCFGQWTARILSLHNVFNWSDLYLNLPPKTVYPVLPIALYGYGLFGLIGKIIFGHQLFTSPFIARIFLKLLAIVSDLLIGFFIYKLLAPKLPKSKAIVISLFFLLNPAIFFVSSLWGQIDALGGLMVLVSIYFLNKKSYSFAWIFIFLAILTKLQSIFFLPLIFIMDFWTNHWQKTLINIAKAGLIVLLILLPFVLAIPKIVFILFSGAGFYAYLSVNAFNFWHILQWRPLQTNFILENNFYLFASMAIFAIIYFLIIKKLLKNINSYNLIFASMLIAFGAFMFLTEMHERYLFPAVMFMSILLSWQKKYLANYILITVCYLANLIFALFAIKALYQISIIFAILNLVNFAYLFYEFYQQKSINSNTNS
jgi:Gpi18-like mannosyltransferase